MTGEAARVDVQEWDVITLSGLKAVANHGVYDFERAGSQDFLADITLFVDARKAAETDDVQHTVDYSQVAEDAIEILKGPAVSLIETLASLLAEMALTYPGVRRVAVTVHKPMAPLKQQFTDVSVTVIREKQRIAAPHAKPAQAPERPRPVAPPMPRKRRPRAAPNVLAVTQLEAPKPPSGPKRPAKVVYKVVLALGGNRGDTAANLRGAVSALANLEGFEMEAVSPLVRTKPVLEKGALPQGDYLNAVVLGTTVMAPPALLAATQKIEADFGRVRVSHWGARTLDIDIVSLDRMQLKTRTLTLPHPRAHGRAFVLYPWLAVDEDAYLAGAGYVRDLLPQTEDLPGVLAQYPQWLDGDTEGGLGVEEPLELAPREPEEPKTKRPLTGERVTLRGESVRLADMAGDPLFQELLEVELARNTARDAAEDVFDVVSDVAREPETTGKIPVIHRGSSQPQTFPPRRSRAKEAPGRDAELPEWDFTTRPQPPRVVDSVDREESNLPTVSRVPRVARNVTMRPTPTGSIPVRRQTGAVTQS